MAKVCTRCRQEKSVTEFSVRRASKDGLNYVCKPCSAVKIREWRVNNRDEHRAYSRRWQAENKVKANARSRAWRTQNPERRKKAVSDWQQRNPAYMRSKCVERRLRIVTPTWADKSKIAAFYREAKRIEDATGIAHHVDHIVPINNQIVCGLHVHSNLRVIPATVNLRKSNRFWPDMPT